MPSVLNRHNDELEEKTRMYTSEILAVFNGDLMGFSLSKSKVRKANDLLLFNSEKNQSNPIAKGLAILTVAKAGMLLTYKLGTGLVMARRADGSWSAPSAIISAGLGWGAQAGGELMDFIIVLHDYKAVKTLCSRMHFSLGAGCSAAAGPVGRVLEADLRAGDRGSGMCYTYSFNEIKETFGSGASLEWTLGRNMLSNQEWTLRTNLHSMAIRISPTGDITFMGL
ncbi:Ysc84 actin-binding domain-containing protein [Tanacetum coccineum]